MAKKKKKKLIDTKKKDERKAKSKFEEMQKFLSIQQKEANKKNEIPKFGTIKEHGKMNLSKVQITGLLSIDLLAPLISGRIYEYYGPESSGKSSLAMHIIERLQMSNPYLRISYFDAEQTVDDRFIKRFNFLNFENAIYNSESIAEQIFEKMNLLIDKNLTDIIVVDSIGQMTTLDALKTTYNKKVMGRLARMMSRGLSDIAEKLNDKDAILIFINQTRNKIGVNFGNPETTPGGEAVKFAASARIRTSSIKSEARTDGNKDIEEIFIKLQAKKNKVGRPFKEKYCYLNVNPSKPYSFNSIYDTLSSAVENGVVEQSGSWYSVYSAQGEEIMKKQGMENLEEECKNDPDLLSKMKLLTYKQHLMPYEFYYLYDKITKTIEKENELIKKEYKKIKKPKGIKLNEIDMFKRENMMTKEEIKEAKNYLKKVQIETED